MTDKNKPIHLLIRFSDTFLRGSDTISEHLKVIEKKGAVWFGKMGATVAQRRIDVLNQQISDEIPTFVYLVKGNRLKSTAYRGKLIFSSKILPKDMEDFVPAYYSDLDLLRHMHFWVKLSEIAIIDFSALNHLKVTGSVLPIRETLVKSSSGHFFLSEAKHY